MLSLTLRPSRVKLPRSLPSLRSPIASAQLYTSAIIQEKNKGGDGVPLVRRVADRHITKVRNFADEHYAHPIWGLLKQLSHPRITWHQERALKKNGVTLAEYNEKWSAAATAPDAKTAFLALSEGGLLEQCPTWLLLHIAGSLIQDSNQALQLLKLVLQRLDKNIVEPDLAPWLLIYTAHALSRDGTIAPLRRVIHAFLHLPNAPNTPHFNLLLLAVSRFPSSSESAQVALTLIDAMTARQKRLWDSTYLALLEDRFVTLELTKVLQQRMVARNVVPSVGVLERFLKIFAQNGAIHDARNYLDAIREHLKGKARAPYGSSASHVEGNGEPKSGTITKWNTQYLSAFSHDHVSAFEYLESLILAQQSSLSPTPRVSPPRPQSRLPFKPTPRLPLKTSADIHDWTTALSIAARDKTRVSAAALLRLFNSTPHGMHPTSATYTTVIRGLATRGAYEAVMDVWDQFEHSGLRMDSKALAVGAQALASARYPLRALELLERIRSSSPGIIDTAVVNALMTALLRAGRADATLVLYDHMQLLYKVQPDTASLTLMLDAARMASREGEQSVRGVLTQFAAGLPSLRSRPDRAQNPVDRSEILQRLQEALPGRAAVSTGLWNGTPAWSRARDIFRGVMLGNFPELAHVRGPVAALRTSPDDSTRRPFVDFARRWTSSGSGTAEATSSNKHDNNPEVLGMYARFSPADGTFRAYILLLGEAGSANEIPQLLAWARALDVTLSPPTLAAALVFWAEVSLGPPLMERDDGVSRYGTLVLWLTEWVGNEGVPDEARVGRWIRKIARMREGRELSGR